MRLRMFGVEFKAVWLATVILTSIVELTPFHSEGMPPPVFYAWKAFKCLLFLAVGWETPLSFWQSGKLAYGLVLGCAVAGAIEAIQNSVVGHRFSIFELMAKSAIIFAGFALGLVARHDEIISLGALKVRLTSSVPAAVHPGSKL